MNREVGSSGFGAKGVARRYERFVPGRTVTVGSAKSVRVVLVQAVSLIGTIGAGSSGVV
jgi:hypothetical protein